MPPISDAPVRRPAMPAVVAALAALFAGGAGPLLATALPRDQARAAMAQVRLAETYGKLPLLFERNEGQADAAVGFLCRAGGMTLLLSGGESVLALRGAAAEAPAVVRMELVGGSPRPRAAGKREQAAKSHYLLGADPAGWRTGVPNFAAVRYSDVYPGIDLVYHGDRGRLEYDFVVAPGGRPEQIRLRFSGVERLRIGGRGELLLHTSAGVLAHEAPVAYQRGPHGPLAVAARYELAGEEGVALLKVGAYDRSRELVIDPVILYGTYLGGSSGDAALAIAVDGAGNAYVTGQTGSTDFPVGAGALQAALAGVSDAFVAKLDPTGTNLVYSTYLGGSGSDLGNGIALDGAGNAYVTGRTESIDFPSTAGAFQTVLGGPADAFVTQFDATGSNLVYSTFLGGFGTDQGTGIAVGGSGNAYVTGGTNSTDMSTTAGTFQSILAGSDDAFVTRLDAAGTTISYSTYLGGSASDSGLGIAVDGAGNAFVTGETLSANFPVTLGAFQAILGGSGDGFVTRLDAAGTTTLYSTYLGGAASDLGAAIALDSAGNAWVTGFTSSTSDFPLTAGAGQAAFGGGPQDAFVTALAAGGGTLVHSTYLGGTALDEGNGIALDGAGGVYLAGSTTSTDFPGTAGTPIQPALAGSDDAFVVKLGESADLAIAKDDGSPSAIPGGSTSYTIVVSNSSGPSAVTGAIVGDAFPAACANVDYTSIAAGGASGNTAEGNGDIADVVDLPVGSSITYLATCTISPAAAGALVNTASVAAPAGVSDPDGGNDSAADSDVLTVAPAFGVAFAPGTVIDGQPATKTFTITNPNPIALTGLAFDDAFPAGLEVADPAMVSDGCGFGAVLPAPGDTSLSLAGGTVAAGGTCAFAVEVVATTAGSLQNSASG